MNTMCKIFALSFFISLNIFATFEASSLPQLMELMGKDGQKVEIILAEEFREVSEEDRIAVTVGFGSCVKLASGVFLSIGHNFRKELRHSEELPPVTVEQAENQTGIKNSEAHDEGLAEVFQIVQFDERFFVVRYLENRFVARPVLAMEEILPNDQFDRRNDHLKGDLATLIFTKEVDSFDGDKYLIDETKVKPYIRPQSGFRASFMANVRDGFCEFKKVTWELDTNLVDCNPDQKIVRYNNVKFGTGASGGVLTDENKKIVGVISQFEEEGEKGIAFAIIEHLAIWYKRNCPEKYVKCTFFIESCAVKMTFKDSLLVRLITKQDVEQAFLRYRQRISSPLSPF